MTLRRPAPHPSSRTTIGAEPVGVAEPTTKPTDTSVRGEPIAATPASATSTPTTTPTPSMAEVELNLARESLASMQEQLAQAQAAQTDVEQIRQELAAARAQGSTYTQERDALMAEIQQLRNSRNVDEVSELLSEIKFTDEDGIDPELGGSLRDKVLRPVLIKQRAAHKAELDAVRAELAAITKKVDGRFDDIGKTKTLEQRQKTNARILEKHPDFVMVQGTKTYKDLLDRKIPGSRQTYGEAMSQAYEAHDADYVNDVLTNFKQSLAADPTKIAEVGGGQATTATTPAGGDTGQNYKYSDLASKRAEFLRGEIDRKAYQAFIKEFETAEATGRVS